MAFWISVLIFCYMVPIKCDGEWKTHPFLKENVAAAIWLKNILSTLFWTRVRSKSCGEWPSPHFVLWALPLQDWYWWCGWALFLVPLSQEPTEPHFSWQFTACHDVASSNLLAEKKQEQFATALWCSTLSFRYHFEILVAPTERKILRQCWKVNRTFF